MNPTKIAVFCTLIIYCLVPAACAQKPKQVLEWVNTIRPVSKNFYSEIPFEYRNDHIIIKVKIKNEVYDYVFDTGGYNDITDDIQRKNNFPLLTTQTVGSANQLKSKVNIVKVDSLSIGDLVITDLAALQMNFENLPSMCGINGALIGASIIKNFCWQIDFPAKKIIVTDDFSRLPLPANAIKVPVTFNERLMPYIEATLNGKTDRYMFDLGSSSLISQTEKTARRYIKDKQTIGIYGGAIEGGNGVVKLAVNIYGAETVEIGNSVVYKGKPVVYTALSNENLIGNPIIKGFIVTLNFKDNELYLSPVPDPKAKEGWHSFGFKPEYKNGKIVITSIYEGMSAQEAGLEINDEITAMDDQPLACNSYCDCKPFLDSLLQNNSSLRLEVKGSSGIKKVVLTKEKVY